MILVGVLFGSCTRKSEPTPPAAHGTAIQTGDIPQIESLLTAHRGRWVLMNLWATWCRPCVAETPALVGLAGKLTDRPFTMIGISLDLLVANDEPAAVRKVTDFAAKYQMSYPTVVFSGSTDDLIQHFSLTGVIPTTILYDPDGREQNRWIGALTDSDLDQIRRLVS
ncbi:MAG: TlpA family protein disulfide reductase [Candidatus Zixiibacteriota bacterium]